MAIRKFKGTVTRVNEYEIEIDDSIYTPEYLKAWEKSFYDAPEISDFVEHLAGTLTQYENDHRSQMEGFGIVRCFYSNGTPAYASADDKYVNGLKVIIVQEDNSDMEIDIDEID